MKKFYPYILAVAGVHLILVVMGAAQFDWTRVGAMGKYFQNYGEVTGSGSGFGFFAPGVGHQLRAEFDVTDLNGKTFTTSVLNSSTHESDIRIGNVITSFGRNSEDEKSRRALVASWAGKVFSRYPTASEVVVRLESFTPVNVKNYREGKRSEWKHYYRAKFKKRVEG